MQAVAIHLHSSVGCIQKLYRSRFQIVFSTDVISIESSIFCFHPASDAPLSYRLMLQKGAFTDSNQIKAASSIYGCQAKADQ